MRAVEFDGAVRVVERVAPAPDTDEVVIRPRLAGICQTDLELMRGYKSFTGTLGHEFVGDVVAGPKEWIGQRVVGEINVSCGACDMCRRGLTKHCRRRRVLGLLDYEGAFADAFRLPVRNLWRVPETVSDDAAVFAEPLAAACHVLEAVHVAPADRVAVIGAGKLGLLVGQVLKLTGAELSVVARRESQRAMLAAWSIPAVGEGALPPETLDVVVDCTGTPSGFAAALDLVRPCGTIVLKSTYAGVPEADLTRIAVEEIKVVGSRCGRFGPALHLMEIGAIDPRPMIEARYPLAEAPRALEHAGRPGALKVLLVP